MTVASFEALCTGLCEVAGIPMPDLSTAEEGIAGMTVSLRGIDVSIVQMQQVARPCAFVHVDFGAIDPKEEPSRWQALMEANFVMLGRDAPAFSRNPDTGRAVLQQAWPFEQAGAVELYQAVLRLVDAARNWQAGRLAPRAPLQPSPAAAAADFA